MWCLLSLHIHIQYHVFTLNRSENCTEAPLMVGLHACLSIIKPCAMWIVDIWCHDDPACFMYPQLHALWKVWTHHNHLQQSSVSQFTRRCSIILASRLHSWLHTLVACSTSIATLINHDLVDWTSNYAHRWLFKMSFLNLIQSLREIYTSLMVSSTLVHCMWNGESVCCYLR